MPRSGPAATAGSAATAARDMRASERTRRKDSKSPQRAKGQRQRRGRWPVQRAVTNASCDSDEFYEPGQPTSGVRMDVGGAHLALVVTVLALTLIILVLSGAVSDLSPRDEASETGFESVLSWLWAPTPPAPTPPPWSPWLQPPPQSPRPPGLPLMHESFPRHPSGGRILDGLAKMVARAVHPR